MSTMWILDTNILSELFKRNSRILEHLNRIPESDHVVTTCISRYEIINGRYASVFKAADKNQLLIAMKRLADDEVHLSKIEILDITDPVAELFDRLRHEKKLTKIGRADLLIACISLANDATLVTRNVKDFKNVPGLHAENWTD